MTPEELRALHGQRVRAKRLRGGVDDDLHDYPRDDLTGVLLVTEIPATRLGVATIPSFVLYLVDGQEADPATIQPEEA